MEQSASLFDIPTRLQVLRYLTEINPDDPTTTDEYWLSLTRNYQGNSLRELLDQLVAQKRVELMSKFSLGVQPRSYQIELFERIVLAPTNHIMFLPTGTGKTLVSFMYTQYMIRQHADKHVVFLAMSVALVTQQYFRYLELTGAPRDSVGLFYGGKTTSEPSVEQLRVIFATPVVYRQMLDARQCFIHHCSLVVFDEVHHARKNHPYAALLKSYIMRELPLYRPRVLGMTASPGEGRDLEESLSSIDALCSNVNAEITTPIFPQSVEELKACSGFSKTIISVYDQTDADTQIQTILADYVKHCLKTTIDLEFNDRTLSNANNPVNSPSPGFGPQTPSSRRSSLLSDLKMVFSLFENGDQTLAISDPIAPRMITIVQALDSETPPSNTIIKALVGNILAAWDAMDELADLGMSSGHESVMALAQPYQDALETPSNPHSAQRKSAVMQWNAKKKEIGNKLMTAYQGRAGSGKVKCLMEYLNTMDSTSKAIVFVQMRSTAIKLAQFLQTQIPPSTGVDCLVGKAEMSANGQLSAVRRFNEGQFRVLIATSVAEEGMDIQACDLVIRLDGTQSSKSLIQSRGRARSMDSRYVLVVSAEEKDQLDLIMKKEQFMLAAVRCQCDPAGLEREGINMASLFEEYASVANVALATSTAFSALHQWYQQRYMPMPEVTYVENDATIGARFTAKIIVEGKEFSASGGQKQEAKYKAATLAWNYLQPERLPHLTPMPSPQRSASPYNWAPQSPQHSSVAVKQEAPSFGNSYAAQASPQQFSRNVSPAQSYHQQNNANQNGSSTQPPWSWSAGGFASPSQPQPPQAPQALAASSPNTRVEHNPAATNSQQGERPSPSMKMEHALLTAPEYRPSNVTSPQQPHQHGHSQYGWQQNQPPMGMQGAPQHAQPYPSHPQPYQAQQHQQPQQQYHQGQQYYGSQPPHHQQQARPPPTSFSEAARPAMHNTSIYRPPVSVHPSRLNSANPIGSLQELCQQHGLSVPDYDDLGQDPHSGDFVMVCKMLGLTAHGQGRQKKVAKTKAAGAMLLALFQRQQPS